MCIIIILFINTFLSLPMFAMDIEESIILKNLSDMTVTYVWEFHNKRITDTLKPHSYVMLKCPNYVTVGIKEEHNKSASQIANHICEIRSPGEYTITGNNFKNFKVENEKASQNEKKSIINKLLTFLRS